MRPAIIGLSLLLALAGGWWYGASPPSSQRGTVPADPQSGRLVTVRYENVREDPDSNRPSSPVEFRIGFYPGIRLLQAVAPAGGWPQSTKMKALRLVRANQTTAIDLRTLNPDGSNHPLLQAGDLIRVPGSCPLSGLPPGK